MGSSLLTTAQVFLLAWLGRDARLVVSPVGSTAGAGSAVRLNCSTDLSKPVNWQFGPDSTRMADLFIGGEGLVRPYTTSGRHTVDVDPATGRYDLIITNLSAEDGGVYVCSEKASRDTPPEARLTVTGAQPRGAEFALFEAGGDATLRFPACTLKPFYVDHVPVGSSHADDLYNNGKLLNAYADGGRLRVDDAGAALALHITSVRASDAGAYTCRESSGLGAAHAADLVVVLLGETCGNHSCAISLAGRLEPLLAWTRLNCNGSRCAPGAVTSRALRSCTAHGPPADGRLQLRCDSPPPPAAPAAAPAARGGPLGRRAWAGLSVVGFVFALTVLGLTAAIVLVARRRGRPPARPAAAGDALLEPDALAAGSRQPDLRHHAITTTTTS